MSCARHYNRTLSHIMADISWPKDTHRLYIGGRTGSGKTQAAAWHLSERSITTKPWIIIDFKRDALLNEIGAEEKELSSRPPKKPGLYIVHALPHEEDEVDDYLWKIWEQENTGIYIDEGFMMKDGPGLRAVLTQGRSKHIPVIVLSQRPTWLSRFVFSEADFFQQFPLNDKDDRKIVGRFVPYDPEALKSLPEHWSVWYDVGRNRVNVLKPVPERDAIIATFQSRLERRKLRHI